MKIETENIKQTDNLSFGGEDNPKMTQKQKQEKTKLMQYLFSLTFSAEDKLNIQYRIHKQKQKETTFMQCIQKTNA